MLNLFGFILEEKTRGRRANIKIPSVFWFATAASEEQTSAEEQNLRDQVHETKADSDLGSFLTIQLAAKFCLV